MSNSKKVIRYSSCKKPKPLPRYMKDGLKRKGTPSPQRGKVSSPDPGNEALGEQRPHTTTECRGSWRMKLEKAQEPRKEGPKGKKDSHTLEGRRKRFGTRGYTLIKKQSSLKLPWKDSRKEEGKRTTTPNNHEEDKREDPVMKEVQTIRRGRRGSSGTNHSGWRPSDEEDTQVTQSGGARYRKKYGI